MQIAKIKGRMTELGIKQKDVAKAWNCAEPTENQKLNGVRPIDLEEADILAMLLKFSKMEYYLFFDKEIA
ncbi:MAG: hypothetical protein J5906_02205 [Acidaminococcaceae bacterium]|nr:hypothetical protein [Acidaminococcaceae bacterium]